MAEKNGNGRGIKMGQVFDNERGLREALPEGYGVIVFSRFDGKMVAYGDAWPLLHEELEANLSGARVAYGKSAVLVKRENGVLVCQMERKPEPKKTKRAWW